MTLRRITDASIEPVSLQDVRSHLRITDDHDDADLSAMITTARQVAEQRLGRQLLTATWELSLEEWPADDVIVLPRPPLASVTSVKYYDAAGVQQTLSSATYYVDTVTEPGRVALRDGQSWPSLESGRPAPITVRYVAGWTRDIDVPQSIRNWVKLHVGMQYEVRELAEARSGTPSAVMPYLDALLDEWMVY